MVKKMNMTGIIMGIMLFFFGQALGAGAAEPIMPSGEIINGFRVLSITGNPSEWVVFRGDYIKIKLEPGMTDPVLSIPSLSIEKALVADLAQAPYFKMKEEGTFDFFIGSRVGTLNVVEYDQVNYEAISAQKAQQVIAAFNPMILDVRTPNEYLQGHLEHSVLIPVQQLQSRMDELAAFRDDPILIYCATGNRSTVAAKLLIDKGFTRIFNLRHGIGDWIKEKLPVVK